MGSGIHPAHDKRINDIQVVEASVLGQDERCHLQLHPAFEASQVSPQGLPDTGKTSFRSLQALTQNIRLPAAWSCHKWQHLSLLYAFLTI